MTTKKTTKKQTAKTRISGTTGTPKQKASRGTTKKKTKKTTAKKVFIEVPEGSYFILVNGERLGHYVQLADRLETLEQWVVDHHVTPFRHDFAKWIKDVFEEKELAEKVKKLRDPEKIRNAIYKHVIKKHLR